MPPNLYSFSGGGMCPLIAYPVVYIYSMHPCILDTIVQYFKSYRGTFYSRLNCTYAARYQTKKSASSLTSSPPMLSLWLYFCVMPCWRPERPSMRYR
jgi:hypothetical protein